MNRSEFEEHTLALIARGYSPIPIAPGTKAPGERSPDGSWRFMLHWERWCTERVSEHRVRAWGRMVGDGDAGIGVALGRGLICVDIDQEFLLDPTFAILPPSPVQKKGRKGISAFYRGDTEKIRSRNYRTEERIGLVDLLAEGKQTVMPPSIHPDTNEPYFWWTDLTLADVDLADLPELPDDIADQIGEVLREFGYDPDRERSAALPASNTSRTSVGERNVYREINDLALSHLHLWVPHLGLRRLYRAGGGFKAVAEWRSSGNGRAFALRAPNLSFTSHGIRDFGDGRGYSALDVTMAALQLELEGAFGWLAERLGYNDEPEIILVNGPKTLERIVARDAARKVVAR